MADGKKDEALRQSVYLTREQLSSSAPMTPERKKRLDKMIQGMQDYLQTIKDTREA